jgi:ABC-type uncharacterized transport system substrate-binding protein
MALCARLGSLAVAAAVLSLGAGSPRSAPHTRQRHEGKRILHIDSYHAGYEWSDAIREGIASMLDGTGVRWKTVHMDSKRRPAEEEKQAAAQAVRSEIARFKPDLIIAADDNASKYVIVPHYKDASVPVVFCGVNWDASIYGYPYRNATGMLEVEFGHEMVTHLRRYARGNRFAILAVDNESDRATGSTYLKRFGSAATRLEYVRTFAEFQRRFLALQKEVDYLYLANNAGIEGWDDDRAEQLILQNTRIPTGSHNPWMARYALITLAKFGQEQGVWAARSALKILSGTAPAAIPIAQNARVRLIVNLKVAEKLGVVFESAILRTAEIYGRTPPELRAGAPPADTAGNPR